MNRELLSYAADFVSFLLDNLEDKNFKKIKGIILFGSVARGTAEKESDVDIFVNITESNGLENVIDHIKEDFYKSESYRKWKLRGIENNISIITDRLSKWKDLKISILSDGIALYSKYMTESKGDGEVHIIFYWDKIGNESKRVLLSKKLYGYRLKKSKYKGLIELTGSIKLGTNCILISLDNSRKFVDLFDSLGITAKRIHVSKI